MTDFSYIGSELDVFALASNWKAYYRGRVEKYLGAEVLEVGAGIGSTTAVLCRGRHSRWVCLEPDPAQAAQIAGRIERGQLPACCEARVGTTSDLPEGERFDSVIYIDVLEHIEHDKQEARAAAGRLKAGGHLVVLAPAHQGLYTAFDAQVGHFRRYTKATLTEAVPAELKPRELFYMDSVGAAASACNRYFLKSGTPTRGQILFWDRAMVPLSRLLDPVLGYRLGKSLVGVWQKA